METVGNLARYAHCGDVLPPDAPGCPRCALVGALESIAEDHDTEFLSLHDIPRPGEKFACIGAHELLEGIAHGGGYSGVIWTGPRRARYCPEWRWSGHPP